MRNITGRKINLVYLVPKERCVIIHWTATDEHIARRGDDVNHNAETERKGRRCRYGELHPPHLSTCCQADADQQCVIIRVVGVDANAPEYAACGVYGRNLLTESYSMQRRSNEGKLRC